MTIFEIQKALSAKGFDPGNIDGVWGRRTALAVRAFQAHHNLQVDGVVGPKTLAALSLDATPPADPLDETNLVWLDEALSLQGIKEVPGVGRGRSNDVILQWADNLKLDYADDDVPWCGLFVAHCIGSTLTNEPLPANPLGARNWRKFGAPCPPQPGAVLVFWRESMAGFKGHVGFYLGETGNRLLVLGGNQSNAVSRAWLDKGRLLEARWPATVTLGSGKARTLKDDGKPVSTNEH